MAKKKGSGSSGKNWENVFHSLRLVDFVQIDWRDAELHGRWYAKNMPYTTIYGTRGMREWTLCDNGRILTAEFKYQDDGGSVDEKPPYILESWLRCTPWNRIGREFWDGSRFHSRHWLCAFAGKYFADKRGLKAVKWLQDKAEPYQSTRRSMVVTNGVEETIQALKRWIA